MQIPALSVDLIKLLDKTYPLKNPTLDTPDRMLWRQAGRRDVVETLLFSLEDLNTTTIKK